MQKSNDQFYAQATAEKAEAMKPVSAADILRKGAQHIEDRAASRDIPEGERSMLRCVKAFNTMFGKDLTEVQGWQFMELLKMSRSAVGSHNPDDFEDGTAYAALAGEAAAIADRKEV